MARDASVPDTRAGELTHVVNEMMQSELVTKVIDTFRTTKYICTNSAFFIPTSITILSTYYCTFLDNASVKI